MKSDTQTLPDRRAGRKTDTEDAIAESLSQIANGLQRIAAQLERDEKRAAARSLADSLRARPNLQTVA